MEPWQMGSAYQRFRVCLFWVCDSIQLLPKFGACDDEYGQLGAIGVDRSDWGCGGGLSSSWKEAVYAACLFCGREKAGWGWFANNLNVVDTVVSIDNGQHIAARQEAVKVHKYRSFPN